MLPWTSFSCQFDLFLCKLTKDASSLLTVYIVAYDLTRRTCRRGMGRVVSLITSRAVARIGKTLERLFPPGWLA